jgi:hypothetical protein
VLLDYVAAIVATGRRVTGEDTDTFDVLVLEDRICAFVRTRT